MNSWAALGVNLPFGGVKESGIGRDNGEEGLEAWTQTKLISFSAVPGH